jgi:hypothetical protein
MAEALGTGRDVILGADDPCFGTRNTNENSSRLSSQHPVLGQSGRGTALIDRHPDHTRKRWAPDQVSTSNVRHDHRRICRHATRLSSAAESLPPMTALRPTGGHSTTDKPAVRMRVLGGPANHLASHVIAFAVSCGCRAVSEETDFDTGERVERFGRGLSSKGRVSAYRPPQPVSAGAGTVRPACMSGWWMEL